MWSEGSWIFVRDVFVGGLPCFNTSWKWSTTQESYKIDHVSYFHIPSSQRSCHHVSIPRDASSGGMCLSLALFIDGNFKLEKAILVFPRVVVSFTCAELKNSIKFMWVCSKHEVLPETMKKAERSWEHSLTSHVQFGYIDVVTINLKKYSGKGAEEFASEKTLASGEGLYNCVSLFTISKIVENRKYMKIHSSTDPQRRRDAGHCGETNAIFLFFSGDAVRD